jgi:hypothetical protein
MRSLAKTALVALSLLVVPALATAKDVDSVTPAEIGAARTAADHEMIAKSYDADGAAAEAKAEAHSKMAQMYRSGGGTPKGDHAAMAEHCDRLSQHYRAAAKEYTRLAAAHRKMAQGTER